jgi:hypothetical protein
MVHDPLTMPGAQGQPALRDDSPESNWWRIGGLDAERNLLPRETPWIGEAWPSLACRSRYLEGYRYKRKMMEV